MKEILKGWDAYTSKSDLLNEDARGRIVQHLKLPREVAERLHQVDSKNAYKLAKIARLYIWQQSTNVVSIIETYSTKGPLKAGRIILKEELFVLGRDLKLELARSMVELLPLYFFSQGEMSPQDEELIRDNHPKRVGSANYKWVVPPSDRQVKSWRKHKDAFSKEVTPITLDVDDLKPTIVDKLRAIRRAKLLNKSEYSPFASFLRLKGVWSDKAFNDPSVVSSGDKTDIRVENFYHHLAYAVRGDSNITRSVDGEWITIKRRLSEMIEGVQDLLLIKSVDELEQLVDEFAEADAETITRIVDAPWLAWMYKHASYKMENREKTIKAMLNKERLFSIVASFAIRRSTEHEHESDINARGAHREYEGFKRASVLTVQERQKVVQAVKAQMDEKVAVISKQLLNNEKEDWLKYPLGSNPINLLKLEPDKNEQEMFDDKQKTPDLWEIALHLSFWAKVGMKLAHNDELALKTHLKQKPLQMQIQKLAREYNRYPIYKEEGPEKTQERLNKEVQVIEEDMFKKFRSRGLKTHVVNIDDHSEKFRDKAEQQQKLAYAEQDNELIEQKARKSIETLFRQTLGLVHTQHNNEQVSFWVPLEQSYLPLLKEAPSKFNEMIAKIEKDWEYPFQQREKELKAKDRNDPGGVRFDSFEEIRDAKRVAARKLVTEIYDWAYTELRLARNKGQALQKSLENSVIRYPNGFYWVDLCSEEDDYERQAMGHCGSDPRGDLYSLRDKNHHPHITLTYNKADNVVYQIKGKQNKLPHAKYWWALRAVSAKDPRGFFDLLNPKLEDREIVKGSDLYKALTTVAQDFGLYKHNHLVEADIPMDSHWPVIFIAPEWALDGNPDDDVMHLGSKFNVSRLKKEQFKEVNGIKLVVLEKLDGRSMGIRTAHLLSDMMTKNVRLSDQSKWVDGPTYYKVAMEEHYAKRDWTGSTVNLPHFYIPEDYLRKPDSVKGYL